MIFSKPSISKKSITTLVTLGIIALSYAFYFLVYVENNEKELDDKIYRRLEWVASNIGEKQKVWKKSAKSIVHKIPELDTTTNRTDKETIKNQVKDLGGSLGFEYALTHGDLKKIYYSNGKLSNSLSYFLESILKYDIMDDYVILRNNSIAYQTLKNKIIDEATIKSDSIGEFTIANQKYKHFDHRFEFDDNEYWVVIGLVNKNKYLNITKSINLWIILNFFLFILVIIVGMPFLKLVLMNPIERLFRANVCFSGISFILGVPLIVLFLLVIQDYFFHENDAIEERLELLSESVTNNFNKEIKSGLRRINSLENQYSEFLIDTSNVLTLKKSRPQIQEYQGKHRFNLETDKEQNVIKFSTKDTTSNVILDFSKTLNEIFWVDDEGGFRIRISKKNKESVLIEFKDKGVASVKTRDYFKAIKTKNTYPFTFKNEDGRNNNPINDSIFIQSIYSFASTKPEVAISKKSNLKLIHESKPIDEEMAVVAITIPFEKVMNPILPLGYSYCIINKAGDVLIHSNNKKNLQENLLKESDNSGELSSYLFGDHNAITNIDYNNKKHKVYINKLGKTPLYLITMCNLEYAKAKVSEIWSVSLILFLIALALLAILLLLYYLMTAQKRKLLIKAFFFEWITPRVDAVETYQKLTTINSICILFVLIYFMVFSHNLFDPLLFVLVLLPTISFVFTHLALNGSHKKQNKNKFIIGVLFVVLITISFFFILEDVKTSIYLFFLTAGIFIIQSSELFKIKTDFNVVKKLATVLKINTEFPHSYACFLLSWLVFSSLLPMVLIFLSYSNIENVLWEAYSDTKFKSEYHLKTTNNKDVEFNKYIIKDSINQDSATDNDLAGFRTFITKIRPGYNPILIENGGLIHKIPNVLINQNTKVLSETGNNNLFQYILKVIIPFFLVGVLFLYFIYKLIVFCIYKIYGLDFNPLESFDLKKLKKAIKHVLINEQKNIILIGVPGAGKITFLESFLPNTFLKVDFRNGEYFSFQKGKYELKYDFVANVKAYKGQFIILDHFQFDNDDNLKNDIKLEFLKEIKSSNTPIVIVTELHPSDIINYSYRSIIVKNTGKVDKDILKDQQNKKENWRQLLTDFTEFYLPLSHDENKINETDYKKELSHGNNLQQISAHIINNKRGIQHPVENDVDPNNIISIQNHANSYYFGLWNSLSRNEKFVVFDLAIDGFVNTSNTLIINRLMDKGIIIFDNKLKLMNKSFANFILTIINEGEILEMNKEVQKKGKWGNIKQVIILVVIALIVLIGLGQPDFLKNINAVVATIAGIVSVIPSIINAISLTRRK